MNHELGLTNDSSDIETTPYHGENELKEGVLEALEKSCQAIREFQQEQYAELMKLINSEALKLARLQFPENMRELSITMRNKKAPEQARENARAQVREIVDFMKRVIMEEIKVGEVDDPPIENARNIVNGVIEDYDINRNDPQAVLDALGVLRIDEEGKKTYRYPGEPLMPQQLPLLIARTRRQLTSTKQQENCLGKTKVMIIGEMTSLRQIWLVGMRTMQ